MKIPMRIHLSPPLDQYEFGYFSQTHTDRQNKNLEGHEVSIQHHHSPDGSTTLKNRHNARAPAIGAPF
jgi:hypothetical protein